MNQKKPTRRERKGAKELLRLGLKVYDYRKDRLSPVEARGLNQANHGLKTILKDGRQPQNYLKIRQGYWMKLCASLAAIIITKKLGGEHRNAASCSDCDSGNKKLFHSALYHSNKFYVSFLLRDEALSL